MTSVIYVIAYTSCVCVCKGNHCTSVQYVCVCFHSHLHSAALQLATVLRSHLGTLTHSCAVNPVTTWLWFFSFSPCMPCSAQGLHPEVRLLPRPHRRHLPALVEARGTVGRKPRMRFHLNNFATWSTTQLLTMSAHNGP